MADNTVWDEYYGAVHNYNRRFGDAAQAIDALCSAISEQTPALVYDITTPSSQFVLMTKGVVEYVNYVLMSRLIHYRRNVALLMLALVMAAITGGLG